MTKLHVERGLTSDKCFGGVYSAIVDEWGSEIATTPDDNEHLDVMASAHELQATNAALVEALEAIDTACKIPFSQLLVQEMAQNALKLAKGE